MREGTPGSPHMRKRSEAKHGTGAEENRGNWDGWRQEREGHLWVGQVGGGRWTRKPPAYCIGEAVLYVFGELRKASEW